MSLPQNVDMVEEDASDLQFPKDKEMIKVEPGIMTEHKVQYYKAIIDNFTITTTSHSYHCQSCRVQLQEPYILCAECSECFCVLCFSKGAESTKHRNTHAYIVRHDNIPVFPKSNWTAREEKRLLDMIAMHGYGNWEDIAKGMRTRSQQDCEEHYKSNYFGGVFERTLNLAKEPYFPIRTPYLYKMKNVEPPRCDLDSMNFRLMAGYRCARGDFDTPYDPSAESLVSSLYVQNNSQATANDIEKELLCGVFKAYNNRLRERQRRYNIMRDHGLLVARRTLGWITKHTEALAHPTRFMGRFVAFMQLMPAIQFDSLVESMQYACDLSKYLFRLYEFRKNGIRSFHGGKIYCSQKARKTTRIRDKRAEQIDSILDWRNLVPNEHGLSAIHLMSGGVMPNSTAPRRKALPLEIIGFPGYDKLSDDERGLCSSVRLTPLSYIGYKTILLAENARIGYLRLADARRLIKIDVNKTRKVYDFLVKHGFVNKPFN